MIYTPEPEGRRPEGEGVAIYSYIYQANHVITNTFHYVILHGNSCK